MRYDVLLVAAALDELSKESEVGSLDNAQIVVNAFHDLEPRATLVTEIEHTKKGGSTQGHTDLGNVNIKDKDEKVTDVRGVKYTRVGKWKIWRGSVAMKNTIWFTHFLSQGVHDGVRDREFFIEYDENLVPKGFAYIGEREEVFRFWPLTVSKRKTVPVFGEISKYVKRIKVSVGF
jgi:hypothetical protein